MAQYARKCFDSFVFSFAFFAGMLLIGYVLMLSMEVENVIHRAFASATSAAAADARSARANQRL